MLNTCKIILFTTNLKNINDFGIQLLCVKQKIKKFTIAMNDSHDLADDGELMYVEKFKVQF